MQAVNLAGDSIEPLGICALLTLLAALLTVVLSLICGSTVAFHARPVPEYGAALTLLFLPFAVGGSVWAYSVARLASCSGLQGELVSSTIASRGAALLLLCLARTVPLATFFCATTLHRYTSDIRAYLQIHQFRLPFFLLCSINRIPKAIVMLLGLFGGSLMATESALATFLYRANPGTGPETANILLARVFREIYASVGADSLPSVATLGAGVSLILLGFAFVGTWLGAHAIFGIRVLLTRSTLLARKSALVFSFLPRLLTICTLLPGVIALVGLFVPLGLGVFAQVDAFERVMGYKAIVALGMVVSALLTFGGLSIALRLRYSRKDLLALFESQTAAACVLLLPAFVPVLSLVAVLGIFAQGQLAGLGGYSALFISHVCLHYPIFQFIGMTLIAAIPESRVSWQRSMKMRYGFSLVTDGFRRHAAVIVCLIGLGTVQVVTDDSVSRWFSPLVSAPEEALYAAVFGRLSSAPEAAIIAWCVAIVALAICAVLAAAYVRELRGHSSHA